MRIPDETRDQLAVKFAVLFPHLDERQRRLLMAAEARSLGHGGIRAVGRAAGVSETTIRKGMSDLEAGESLVGRVRRPGLGTSKWNKIEHRLFSHITMNWRGRPLTSHEVILESITATTTRAGLRVKAQLDTNTYPTGIGVGDAEMAALPLTRHNFHGDWNYALHPRPTPAIPAARNGQPPTPQWDPALLSDPALTGLAPHQLQHLIETLAAEGDTRRGRPPRLTFADQVVATVLQLRVNLAAEPLAVLFNSSRTAMHRTLLKIRKLLEAHGIKVPPATTPPTALATLQARVIALDSAPNSKIKTTC